LKYTEAILAESSMRLYPPAWVIGRTVVEEHTFGGYQIRPGSLVLASPFIMQRDARFWENPEAFIPERWEKLTVKESGSRNIYFPFGGGVRRCIGESFAWSESILLVATIARKWKLRLVATQEIGLNPQITLRQKYGMKMKVEFAETSN
ncbi:MAG: cytochrome P450, partial [Pyrinomonadaceae bacterium]